MRIADFLFGSSCPFIPLLRILAYVIHTILQWPREIPRRLRLPACNPALRFSPSILSRCCPLSDTMFSLRAARPAQVSQFLSLSKISAIGCYVLPAPARPRLCPRSIFGVNYTSHLLTYSIVSRPQRRSGSSFQTFDCGKVYVILFVYRYRLLRSTNMRQPSQASSQMSSNQLNTVENTRSR